MKKEKESDSAKELDERMKAMLSERTKQDTILYPHKDKCTDNASTLVTACSALAKK